MPSLGAKKESTPHTAKAKIPPPRTQFHLFIKAERRPRHTTQITTPKATASITNPTPNKSTELSHALLNNGVSQSNNATRMRARISLLIIGETRKLKKEGFPALPVILPEETPARLPLAAFLDLGLLLTPAIFQLLAITLILIFDF
jgi:hypothetical protein